MWPWAVLFDSAAVKTMASNLAGASVSTVALEIKFANATANAVAYPVIAVASPAAGQQNLQLP